VVQLFSSCSISCYLTIASASGSGLSASSGSGGATEGASIADVDDGAAAGRIMATAGGGGACNLRIHDIRL